MANGFTTIGGLTAALTAIVLFVALTACTERVPETQTHQQLAVPTDPIKMLRSKAEGGDVASQLALGKKLAFATKSDAHNAVEGVRWLEIASKAGNADAKAWLSESYREGLGGLIVDVERAVVLRDEAIKAGSIDATVNIGLAYATGIGVNIDVSKACEYFKVAAEKQDGRGAALYGLCFSELRPPGTPLSWDAAAKWWRVGIQKKYRLAFCFLGDYYRDGRAGTPDYVKAADLYRQGIDQDCIECISRLGRAYQFGIGVPINSLEAARLYQKGADLRDGDSQLALSRLYEVGLGTTKNLTNAYVWSNLAAASTNKKISEAARDRTFLLGLEMTVAKLNIESAQEISTTWKPGSIPLELASTSSEQADVSDGVKKSLGQLQRVGGGTAFVVSADGTMITNFHAITNCAEIRVGAKNQTVKLGAADKSNDLAVLTAEFPAISVASFRRADDVKQGEDVVIFGFPLSGALSATGNVATGSIAAVTGFANNSNHLQFSAPVQQGNSGGPLLDRKGNVIGVVVAKLDALTVARATGDVPQNVNFAIKHTVVRSFLEANHIRYESASVFQFDKSNQEIAEKAKEFTVALECWRHR